MNKIKVNGISLATLKHLSGQLVLLSVLISGIGACKGIILNESVIYVIPYYIISFLGLYCYFAISSLVDVSGKTKILRTNLIDYLENHLANRLEQTSLDLKLVEGTDADKVEKTALEISEGADKQDKQEGSILSHTEAKELETLLKEFLA